MSKAKTGTREWAGTNVNIQLGCKHNCRYCYAKYDKVHRFHKCTAEQWRETKINSKAVDRKYPKYEHQPVMFPSTHDITTRDLAECMTVLRKLLRAGNKVIIVTKPTWACIELMCETFKEYRELIIWRFTIGSSNNETLAFWEPGAPSFEQRLDCLRFAYHLGYETSVSCEPFLDGFVDRVYEATEEFITESFWIGLLRNFDSRVDLAGMTALQVGRFVSPLLAASQPAAVRGIYERMKDKKYVMWKDSIRKIITEAKNGQ